MNVECTSREMALLGLLTETPRHGYDLEQVIEQRGISLLGVAVGASTPAQVFLPRQSILIFVLGCLAFAVATAGGVLFAKLLNVVSSDKINPLIGAAGVSAVPDSARVVHHVGQEEDPANFLLQHALGPNVAGVIGSAIAAGVFLGIF